MELFGLHEKGHRHILAPNLVLKIFCGLKEIVMETKSKTALYFIMATQTEELNYSFQQSYKTRYTKYSHIKNHEYAALHI